MRPWLHKALLLLVAALLALATWVAQRQAPHPDMFRAIGDWDITQPGWWAHPLERNAFKRQIVRGDLHAVFALPQSTKLWAVGQGGLILHSSDDGLTWVQQRPALPAADSASAPRVGAAWSLFSQAMAQEVPNVRQQPPDQKGPPPANLALPGAGFVNQQALPTEKAGPPNPQPVQAAQPTVRAEGKKKGATQGVPVKVTGVPALVLPAVVNSGASAPSPVPAPVIGPRPDLAATADLRAVTFINERNGWAVGDGGTILATTDGGVTWAVQSTDGRADLSSVHFNRDGQRGWAVGDGGTIRLTTNGGATWAAQTNRSTAWLSSVHFSSDGQRGWAVGNGGTILATVNGGATWAAQTSGSTTWLSSVHINSDGQRGWAVGNGGTILATTNGGANWAEQTSGSTPWLTGVQFSSDGQRGVAVGGMSAGAGAILTTINGGGTWAVQYIIGPARLTGMQFSSDGQRAWAVGQGGEILTTTNGGANWVAQTSGSRAWLTRVHFDSEGMRGWTVSATGLFMGTANGGATWSSQSSDNPAWRALLRGANDARPGFGASLVEPLLIAASGAGAGARWLAQAKAGPQAATSVHFTDDGQRGWAVGQYGTVLATSNGGKDWQSLATYQRMWAPWYFAVLLVLALALFALLGLVEPTRAGAQAGADAAQLNGGAATLLRSDQPVADKQFDRLGVKPAVEALSSFVRNSETEPRVTIAVTGEWGNGKSSVMRMLQTELDRAGFRSAWFNAWHHQQEGRQLSALFNVVHQQAVPQWWRQPLAALRVRSRLIWGRGWFYRVVSVALALVLALLLGDMLADGVGLAGERVRLSLAHHVLQRQHTALTGASLAKLDPFAPPASAATAASAAGATSATAGMAAAPSPAASAVPADPCNDPSRPLAKHKREQKPEQKIEHIRPELYCYLQRNLQWSETGDNSHCGVQNPHAVDPTRRCVFDTAQDLLATIEGRGKKGANTLWPSERKAILAAAETLPPEAVFPWLEHSLLGGLAGVLLLLFGKGIAVYGVQLTTPLRTLLASGLKDTGAGKEASGTVERYRAEFGLLCDALDGRLVIFIDDLDRCTPETVTGMLELTNYLVDVGKCFVVIGAAMDRVKRSVRSPETNAPDDAYATAYLRKLVHIELPVPQNRQLLNSLASAAPAQTPGQSQRVKVKRQAVQLAWVAGALALVLAFYLGGRGLHQGTQGRALEVRETVLPQAAASAAATVLAGRPTVPDAAPSRPARVTAVGLDPAPPTPWPTLWLAAGVSLALAGAAWRWLQRHRDQVVLALGGAIRTTDSNRFMQALAIWNPVVVSHDPTPRHVKRFYNRARLFAAYEQQDGAGNVTADECLVALAAMHHLDPASLGVLANALEKTEADGVDPVDGFEALLGEMHFSQALDSAARADPVADARLATLSSAWLQHVSTFKSAPNAAQVRRFARRVEGILVR